VQSAACEALGLIQPDDKEAVVAVLRRKVVHPDPLTRIHASLAIWQMAGDDSGAREAEHGRSTENERYMAARALGRIGSPAKAALPELRRLMSHPDAALADVAAEAVQAIEADLKK
jgi:hypothetical protein